MVQGGGSRDDSGSTGRRTSVFAVGAVLVVVLIVAATYSIVEAGGSDPVVTTSNGDDQTESSEPGDGTNVAGSQCRRWVAEDGDDGAEGSRERPWATLEFALNEIPLAGCHIAVLAGTYEGARVDRRYSGETVLRSSTPYAAVLVDTGTVLDVQGAENVRIEGFEITHAGPGSRGVVLNVEDANDLQSTAITITNNIIHDSYHDDLLKIRSGAGSVTVAGNVFYNQGPREQHIDVNGVHDITIEDNIFSNDFAASGRHYAEDTKAFIVVKDSSATGELGSRRVTIRRNVFMNWQGGRETMLQIGNDGKPYFEAIDVSVENNLILGNSLSYSTAAFGAAGVKNVAFVNNSVVGDLPSGAFALRLDRKRENLANEGVALRNNIFADATGTMGEFSNGDEGGATIDTNLYWNAGQALDREGPVNPVDDANRVDADPGLDYDHSSIGAVIWDGTSFPSGADSIRQEFVRIVERFASLGADSAAVDGADPDFAPAEDILGHPRGTSPDLGAWES